MNLEAHLHESERTLAHIWRATALRGSVAIAFSIVILVWPKLGLTALIVLFGAFALVGGVMQIVFAFELRRVAGELTRPFRTHATAKPVMHG